MAAKRQKTNAGSGGTMCEVDKNWYQYPWMQQVLDNDSSLTSLEVKHADRISNDAAKALAEALRANTTLKRLDVTGDGITDEAGLVLAKAIRVNSTLETLFFDTNSITDKTGMAMAEALRANSTLRSITIFSRHPVTYFFGRDANPRTTEAMLMPDSMDEEDEDSCQNGKRSVQRRQWMTDRTVRAMVETIRVNNTLQRLELGVSNISKNTATAVAQALKANTAMQNLFVNGCAITSAGQGPSTAQRNAQARRKASAMIKKTFPGVEEYHRIWRKTQKESAFP